MCNLRPENMMCRRTVGPKALAQYTVRVSALLRGYAGPYRITKTPRGPTLATQVCLARQRGRAAQLSRTPSVRSSENRPFHALG